VSDIVERLRYWGADDDGWLLIDEGAAEVCLQAADDIERLRAKNAQMREVLEDLTRECKEHCFDECQSDCKRITQCRLFKARAFLAETEPKA